MYSYEDRIRAVELYIKLGKRVRPTIRQLGYPTKNALKGWYREYEQRLDLPWAMRAGNPSTRRRRRRQLLSTTSLTIDALPPP
jgi:transposase-like protein